MEIEQSSMYREIETIVHGGAKPVNYSWEVEILANGETHKPLKILSIDFVRDFEQNYADEIFVTMTVLGGTYAKRIYPFQDKTDITLTRTPVMEVTGSVNDDEMIQSETYTATLIDTGNPIVEATGINSPSEEAMNLANIFTVTFQLVDKALEQLRMVSIGGNFRNVTVEDAVKGILTKESATAKVDKARKVKGVDMVTASNKKARDHIIIPHGLPLVSLPEYIQKRCGGIYSAGLGYYLFNDYWYIYPCFDVTRFNKAQKTLTVINVPSNRFPGIERTYRKDGNNLVIIATGEVKFRDDSNTQQLNSGNGVRFTDAGNLLKDFVKTAGNKTVASRASNNSEVISVERENGNNNVQLSDKAINSNPYVEYSKLARRQGSVISFVWENSNPILLFPGMPVRVMYLDGGDIKEVYGVSLKAHDYTHARDEGMVSKRYLTHTMLSVFVKPIEE